MDYSVISGDGISENIMLTFTRKQKPGESVTVGQSFDANVISYYSRIYPWLLADLPYVEYVDDLDEDELDALLDSELDY